VKWAELQAFVVLGFVLGETLYELEEWRLQSHTINGLASK
jgi:hypothetical protein